MYVLTGDELVDYENWKASLDMTNTSVPHNAEDIERWAYTDHVVQARESACQRPNCSLCKCNNIRITELKAVEQTPR